DEGKVKGFILHHQATKIGYISLPIFYTDWDNTTNNVNGCANDVAREIIQLKKENIDGLILDLRYNGGGSLKEAVELSG
ncbi:S41 family peptidase, partial [Acinetobacter baumannii]